MPRENVAQLIAAGALQPGTAVVDVASAASVRVTTVPRTINYQDCSFGRCVSRMRTDYVDEAVLTLAVTLSVRDIRTGRVIHRVREVADLVGAGPRAERALLDRVMRVLLPHLDQRTERVRLRLLSVPDDRVERALALLREREARAARVLLEEAVRSPEVAALPTEQRARALYDLSVARRLDPTTTSSLARHYAAAKAALSAAIALDPERAFYREALSSLEADEARATALAAQADVARVNAEGGVAVAGTAGGSDAASAAGEGGAPAPAPPAEDQLPPPPAAYQ
jgi:hypothetical protein